MTAIGLSLTWRQQATHLCDPSQIGDPDQSVARRSAFFVLQVCYRRRFAGLCSNGDQCLCVYHGLS
jgi:hypothetical protein